MNWVDIKTQLPPKEYHSPCVQMDDTTSVLVFGYDEYNFFPRYEVMYNNYLAMAKQDESGRYIIDNLIITHWKYIERP